MAIQLLRCFVAAEVGSPVAGRLAREIGVLQLAGAKVGWVPQENLHVTVRFVGDVRTEEIIALQDAIADACDGLPTCRPLARGILTFPTDKPPRVIAAGLEGDVAPIVEAFSRLQDALLPLGIRRERRGLAPHVTLGRVRGAAPSDLLERIEKSRIREFGLFTIDRLHLMMSDQTQWGVEYTSLKAFPLS